MSQAVRDLPDPLDPSPAMSASDPDDLLSKMADEAIDRLIADADNGRLPSSRASSASAATAPSAETPPTILSDAEGPVDVEIDDDDEPAYPPGSDEPGLVADDRIVTVETPETPAEVVETHEAELVAEVAPSDHIEAEVVDETPADEPAVPSSVEAPPPAADRQVLLAEPAERSSVLLLPLQLLNWPFAWLGDNARRVFGLIGIVTLVPAIAAIVYVLWLKQRWGG